MPSNRPAVAAAYAAGATTRELAQVHGVHESTVRAWLAAEGVVTRRVGPPDLPVDDAVIVDLVAAGESWSAIAEAVGMSRSGVRGRWLRATPGNRWR